MQARLLISIIAVFLIGSLQPVQAQQPAKIPRIGYVSGTGDATNQGPYVERCVKGCASLVMSRGKTSRSNIAALRESWTGFQASCKSFVQLKADILIAPIPGAIRAATQVRSSAGNATEQIANLLDRAHIGLGVQILLQGRAHNCGALALLLFGRARQFSGKVRGNRMVN